MGESRWTSGKWSQTYILSISGSLNAVLEQTNSKLPEETDRSTGDSSGFSPASPRFREENTWIFLYCQASAGPGFDGSAILNQESAVCTSLFLLCFPDNTAGEFSGTDSDGTCRSPRN